MIMQEIIQNGIAPSQEAIENSNISNFMKELNFHDVKTLHSWTVNYFPDFWQSIIKKLGIVFQKSPQKICDLQRGVESPEWFPGALMNITDSCFTHQPEKPAIIYLDDDLILRSMSYGELNHLSQRIANSLIQFGLASGDAIAIDMPMTKEAIAAYLGIIKMGGIVVSIADSFSPEEIATRLRISQAKAIFTQDFILRGKKELPLYQKVIHANAPKAIVFTIRETISLRDQDIFWNPFLCDKNEYQSHPCSPMTPCNILFSSGTTGDPKAIPWDHTTPIKVASDAYLHQNIKENDVLAWPTNLGWMMGPWLIFAAFINHATVALYNDVPTEREFGQFIQNAKVTMLGVIPTIVASWRQSHCMEGLNWESIKVFTSTGECSNAEDMLYLMSLAGYKPVIEYCGGTEVGGCYLSSTVIEKNYPSLFTTPAMGLDFVLLDEEGKVSNQGEVALIPPSIGLSTHLLNAKHHDIYFANMPTLHNKLLRRHGDQAEQLSNGYYSILGRIDDTMNLGGIKVSAVEIERVISGIEYITESAAVAVNPPNNGPSQLIIFLVTEAPLDKSDVKKKMQMRVNQHLNPLFKIHDVIFLNALPKTASNKIMRRVLRKQYADIALTGKNHGFFF